MSWMTRPDKNDYALIEDYIVAGGAVQTKTYTGLDIDTDGVYLLHLAILNASAIANCQVQLFFNNDKVVGNYYREYLLVEGVNVTGGRVNNPTIITAEESQNAVTDVVVMRDGTGRGRFRSFGNRSVPASWTVIQMQNVVGAWTTSANITRIDVESNIAGGIANGSRMILFKGIG